MPFSGIGASDLILYSEAESLHPCSQEPELQPKTSSSSDLRGHVGGGFSRLSSAKVWAKEGIAKAAFQCLELKHSSGIILGSAIMFW